MKHHAALGLWGSVVLRIIGSKSRRLSVGGYYKRHRTVCCLECRILDFSCKVQEFVFRIDAEVFSFFELKELIYYLACVFFKFIHVLQNKLYNLFVQDTLDVLVLFQYTLLAYATVV